MKTFYSSFQLAFILSICSLVILSVADRAFGNEYKIIIDDNGNYFEEDSDKNVIYQAGDILNLKIYKKLGNNFKEEETKEECTATLKSYKNDLAELYSLLKKIKTQILKLKDIKKKKTDKDAKASAGDVMATAGHANVIVGHANVTDEDIKTIKKHENTIPIYNASLNEILNYDYNLNNFKSVIIKITSDKLSFDIIPIWSGKISEDLITLKSQFLSIKKIAVVPKSRKGIITDLDVLSKAYLDGMSNYCNFSNTYNSYEDTVNKYIKNQKIKTIKNKTEGTDTYYILIAEKQVSLSKGGMKYIVNIISCENGADFKKQEGINFFNNTYNTYRNYYFGIHFGFYFPVMKTLNYSKVALPKSESNPIPPFDGNYFFLKRDSAKNYSGIGLIAIYPAGYIPEIYIPGSFKTWDLFTNFDKNWVHILRGLQANFGFELSNKIFSKFFIGAGLSLGLVSFHYLACYAKSDVIQSRKFVKTAGNYQIVPIDMAINPPIKTKYNWTHGFSVSFPLDFAAALITRAIEMK